MIPDWAQRIWYFLQEQGIEPFFHRVARSPLASNLARQDAVSVSRRWNYLCSELHYLREEQDHGDDSATDRTPA